MSSPQTAPTFKWGAESIPWEAWGSRKTLPKLQACLVGKYDIYIYIRNWVISLSLSLCPDYVYDKVHIINYFSWINERTSPTWKMASRMRPLFKHRFSFMSLQWARYDQNISEDTDSNVDLRCNLLAVWKAWCSWKHKMSFPLKAPSLRFPKGHPGEWNDLAGIVWSEFMACLH